MYSVRTAVSTTALHNKKERNIQVIQHSAIGLIFVYYDNFCTNLESGPIILRFLDTRIFCGCNNDFP